MRENFIKDKVDFLKNFQEHYGEYFFLLYPSKFEFGFTEEFLNFPDTTAEFLVKQFNNKLDDHILFVKDELNKCRMFYKP